MTISIEVEDEAWLALAGLDSVARGAVAAALASAHTDAKEGEIALLFTSDEAIAEINAEWRAKDKPTNVLSFPAPQNPENHLGDVALAYGVCAREAAEQGKTLQAHYAHLLVHGALHAQGWDHEGSEAEAQAMEAREVAVLAGLGLSSPY
jgi:probable rRNA maturation factor